MAFSESAHWRDSARQARFWIFDSSAVFPFVIFLLHIRWWSFFIAVVTMLFLTVLSRYGFSVPVFLRWLRTTLAGSRKFSSPWWKE